MIRSEETECYNYLVFNFSALIGKLSFESHTQQIDFFLNLGLPSVEMKIL